MEVICQKWAQQSAVLKNKENYIQVSCFFSKHSLQTFSRVWNWEWENDVQLRDLKSVDPLSVNFKFFPSVWHPRFQECTATRGSHKHIWVYWTCRVGVDDYHRCEFKHMVLYWEKNRKHLLFYNESSEAVGLLNKRLFKHLYKGLWWFF